MASHKLTWNTFGRRFIIRLMIISSTHNRRFTKNCVVSIKRWHILLWCLRMLASCIILPSAWIIPCFHCFVTLSFILDIGFSCIVGSPLFTVLYGCLSFSRVAWTLSLSETLYESTVMFSVGVTKYKCWMYIMLVGCEVPALVKVSLWNSSLSTIWIPGLPLTSSGGQIHAFSRSQTVHQSRRWKISA